MYVCRRVARVEYEVLCELAGNYLTCFGGFIFLSGKIIFPDYRYYGLTRVEYYVTDG